MTRSVSIDPQIDFRGSSVVPLAAALEAAKSPVMRLPFRKVFRVLPKL